MRHQSQDGRYGHGEYSASCVEVLLLFVRHKYRYQTRQSPHQPLRLVLGPLRAEELPPLPRPTDCADPETKESGPPVTVFLP